MPNSPPIVIDGMNPRLLEARAAAEGMTADEYATSLLVAELRKYEQPIKEAVNALDSPSKGKKRDHNNIVQFTKKGTKNSQA